MSDDDAATGTSATARAATLSTDFTRLVGVEYPIVQTGMGWVSGPELTAATANAGGLGIIASATMTYSELEAAIIRTKELTSKPFGVNLRADAEDAAERCELMIRHGVKVASFALAPKPELIARLKENGLVVVPSIGAAKHAVKVASWGADAVIVQGGEGGGHTGQVATTLLLPSVIDALGGAGNTSIPVVAGGGFFDGRGLVAALSYGAAGIAMGTRFLLTSDSQVPDAVKQQYLERGLQDTVVSTRVDGMPHRVLRTGLVNALESGSPVKGMVAAVQNANKFKAMTGMKWQQLAKDGLNMKKSSERTWQQIVMAANTPMLLKAGLVEGNTEAGVLASGQVVGMIEDLPSCDELIQRIMTQAHGRLGALRDLG
ncbi:NAD(P)H-dependent flavin oxidoreductase [Dietzia sp. NPDC055877]